VILIIFPDRFGGAEDSEKLVEAIRTRDEDAISQYLTSTSNPSDILIPAILFASHETPYSHSLSPQTVELVRKYCSVEAAVINSIMGFWRDRPATAMVLVMKFVDLEVLRVGGVVQWILGQDGWMRKGWGWEFVQIVVEKVDGLSVRKAENKTTGEKVAVETGEDGNVEEKVEGEEKPEEEEMQVDSTNGVMNGTATVNEERKELFAKIVAGVGACYERQTVLDKEWLKEWFGMVVRKYSADVVGLEGEENWVAEMLTHAEDYRKRFI
jgi:MIF4G like